MERRQERADDGRAGAGGRRWAVLGVLTLLYGAGALGFLGAPSLAPFLLEAFDLTRIQVGLLLPALYVGGLTFSVPSGRVADRIGARLCLTIGLGLGAVMLVAAAAATSFVGFLACLLVTGIGWSMVNPAIGKALLDIFSPRERGLAMGIKQTGQTAGGIGAALILPALAERWGWRPTFGVAGGAVAALLVVGWRPLAVTGLRPAPRPARRARARWGVGPATLFTLGVTGVGLGLEQSAFLSYLPLFATQALGMSKVGAGGLLAAAQAGGAVARLGLGAASDRLLGGRRTPCLMLTSMLTAAAFGVLAWSPPSSAGVAALVAFGAGAGALGWVGLYMLLSGEVGGRDDAGLMTGVGVTFILAGILLGGPLFGFVLEAADSYSVAWAVFALLSCVVTAIVGSAGAVAPPARDPESRRHAS